MKWFYELPEKRQAELIETVWIPVRDAVAASLAVLWGCSDHEVGVEEVAEAAAWTAVHREQFPFLVSK